MAEGTPTPQINVSKIVAGGGIAGALFAVISMAIFLIGIPLLRFFLPAAIVIGAVVALAIHFKRHETPGEPWILADEKRTETWRRDSSLPRRDSSRRVCEPSGMPHQGTSCLSS
jgi:hypothetical protein